MWRVWETSVAGGEVVEVVEVRAEEVGGDVPANNLPYLRLKMHILVNRSFEAI